MIRLLSLLVTVAGVAVAQFSSLSTTWDGTTLYFATPLRLSGTSAPFSSKIFRWDTQLAEYLERAPGPSIGWTTQNFYNLIAAQPSADGSVIAISATRPCYGGSGCLAVQTTQGAVVDSTGKSLFTDVGYVDISPNARWAFFYARNTFGNPIPASEFVDLTTGKTTAVPYNFPARTRRQIANDGTIALISASSVHLWNTSGDRVLAGATPMQQTYAADPLILLSADAARVVYAIPGGLALYDVAAGTQMPIAGPVNAAAISDDASVIAYINSADTQIWLASPSRQLTQEADGMSEVALSGDGRTVYASTTGGRLLRIQVSTGDVTELVPRTPWITNTVSPLVPGSLYQFTGTNLAPAQIRIDGLDAPIASADSTHVWFQVPWEVQPQDSAPLQFLSGDSPFETPPGAAPVQLYAPASLSGDSLVLAAHQDFSGLVTADSPASAGEVIAMYLNGLGPVSPPVATGALSPAFPPAQITGPLRCQFWDGGPNDGAIFFAGLAPGMIGIYQVNIQVPAGLRLSPVSVTCDFGGLPLVSGLLPVKL